MLARLVCNFAQFLDRSFLFCTLGTSASFQSVGIMLWIIDALNNKVSAGDI